MNTRENMLLLYFLMLGLVAAIGTWFVRKHSK